MGFETPGKVEEDWQNAIFSVDETHGDEHIVLTKGDLSAPGPVLVRMHALDTTLDLIGIGPAGRRVVVLLRDTAQKMADTAAGLPSKLRQYDLGAQILSSLGLSQLRTSKQFTASESCRA